MTRPHVVTLAALLALAAFAPAQPPAPSATKPAGDDGPAIELFKAGKANEALQELQKASRANPVLPPPRVRLADLFIRAGQPAPARAQLELAAAEEPRHPAVYLMNANVAFGDRRYTDTILSCRTALELAADPRWEADQRKGFVREARLGLAGAFEARRDWAAAKEYLTAAANDDPKNAAIRSRAAAVTFMLGKPEQALAEFRAAAADDPALDPAELRMAQLYAAKDDPSAAEEWLKKAVAAHDKDPRAARAYAGWLLDNNRRDAAAVYVEAAARLDPKGRETRALQGMAARYARDHPAAERVFGELHAAHPDDPYLAWNLALALADSGDPAKAKRAVELAEAAKAKYPTLPESYAVLGWCYYKAGRVDDADKALGAAATVRPIRLDTAYFAARVLADKGKPAEARTLLADALARTGAFPYRADAEALLKQLPPK